MPKDKTEGIEYRKKLRAQQAKFIELRTDLKHIRQELKMSKEMNVVHEAILSRNTKAPIIKLDKSFKKVDQGVVITLLSDIHAEHKITYAQTNGFNSFNPSMCEERLKHYFNNLLKLTRLMRKGIKLDSLVVGLLGDCIHGFIHEEYMRTNYMTPIEATVWMTEILTAGFKYILSDGNFKDITVICKIGNHSRTTNKIYSDEEAKHSYEWAIYHNLQKNIPEIRWVIDESYFTYMYIYDQTLRFHHGHAFRYMGGIGGIYIPLMRFIAKCNRQIHANMDLIGHWHTRDALSSGACIMNGSVCGANPYSIRLGFPAEEPTQQFQILDADKGFTLNAPIMLFK